MQCEGKGHKQMLRFCVRLSLHFTDKETKVLKVRWPRQGPSINEARTEPRPLNSSFCLLSLKHIENCRESSSRGRVFLFNMQNDTCTLKKLFLHVSLVSGIELWCQRSKLIATCAQTVRNNGLLVRKKNTKQVLSNISNSYFFIAQVGIMNSACLFPSVAMKF